jgi:hypothetical protein
MALRRSGRPMRTTRTAPPPTSSLLTMGATVPEGTSGGAGARDGAVRRKAPVRGPGGARR